MNSHPGGIDIPRRLSLVTQTTAAIRKAVGEDVWQEFLPSERRLCDMFQVSRPTIRTALQQLAKERLIEIHHGRRNRILTPGHLTTAPRSRLVVLVSQQPISHMTLTAYQGISEMRAHLAEQGFPTVVLVCPARTATAQRRKLETFMQQNHVFCCVLLSLSKELQEWFSAHSIPALVLGSCHPSVNLPSLDVGYRSVCRHAVGILRSKGHQRIALIVPNSNVAGDLASEAGFREGFGQRRAGDTTEPRIVRHDGTAANLIVKLDALFASAHRPTALLVAKPQHVLAVVVYLLKHGIRVPETVSLIARDHDHLFENTISHYGCEGETFAHRLSRLMLQLVNEGHLPMKPNLIFQRFVAAGTVKQLSS